MLDLDGSILGYVPPRAVANKFREFQVEALLNQSASLVERCIDRLREYRSLDLSHNEMQLSIFAMERAIDLDVTRMQQKAFERDRFLAIEQEDYLKKSKFNFDASVVDAQAYRDASAGQGAASLAKGNQALNEKKVDECSRASDTTVNAAQKQWAEEDLASAKTDLENRKSVLDQRKALVADAKAFGLQWQRDLVGGRLVQDWANACDRVIVIEHGLSKIFGYKVAAPLPSNAHTVDEAVNQLYSWVRAALEWLVAYVQRDQAFTSVLSLQRLLGGNTWAAAAEGFSASFELPSEAFPRHDNVRLRGIGASLLGAGGIPWAVVLRPPRNAIYMRERQRYPIVQDMPTCTLGRVEDRRSFRAIEICGLVSLMNASPISQNQADGSSVEQRSWVIDIYRPPASHETLSQLADVLLELDAVGLPRDKTNG